MSDHLTGETVDVTNACSGNSKKKVRTWKKPIGKPKRPLSAYNIFFQLERDRIVNGHEEKVFSKADVDKVRIVPLELMPKRRERKIHGKIGFGDLAKIIGSKWKKLNDDEKFAFNERAKLEKIRYRRDVEEWIQKTNESQNCNQSAIREDISNGMKDETQFIAFGGKLGRIFLGDDSSRTDGDLQSIFPGHDDNYEATTAASISGLKNPAGTSTCALDDDHSMKIRGFPLVNNFFSGDVTEEPTLDFPSIYQLENRTPGRTMENYMNSRNPLLNQRYLINHEEGEINESIIAERLPMNTKRAFGRAMAIHEGVRRTFGYGVGRNRSFVASELADQSVSFPLVRRQMLDSVEENDNKSSTNNHFRCVALPISQRESRVGPNGRSVLNVDNYCRGGQMMLQNSNHTTFSDKDLGSNYVNSLVLSDMNRIPRNFSRTLDSGIHRFGDGGYPNRQNSMLVNDYGRFQCNNQEYTDEDNDDAPESMDDSGNFYDCY